MDFKKLADANALHELLKDVGRKIERCRYKEGKPEKIVIEFGGVNVDIILVGQEATELLAVHRARLEQLFDKAQKEFDAL